jgi:hypothetical protein
MEVKPSFIPSCPAMVAAYIYYPRLNIITGFAAKNVCSAVFEAERDLVSVEEGDNDFAPVSLARNEVDLEKKLATSSVFGLKKRTAVYTERERAALCFQRILIYHYEETLCRKGTSIGKCCSLSLRRRGTS